MTAAYFYSATNRSNFGKSLLLAACIALGLGSANQVAAQEAPSNAELYKMLLELKSENAKLKGEVQRLQARTSSPQASAPSSQGGSSSSGKLVASEDYSGKAVYVPAESKLSVGVQVPLLSLNANHGAGSIGESWFDDFDSEAAYRLIAAYESASGLGIRGRYFNYQSGAPDSGNSDYFGLDLGELELTTAFSAAGWDFTGFAGGAMGDISWTDEQGGSLHSFDGTGFTVGIDAQRELSRGFGLVAGARQTMLYGETTRVNTAQVGQGVLVPVSELRAGASYTRSFPRGNKATVELGFESQIIHSLSVNVPNSNIDPEDIDVSLAGPYFSFMFEF